MEVLKENKLINSGNVLIEENECLYVNNLPEKINIDEVKINLFHLFSITGDILDIKMRKGEKFKGQAFILYADKQTAKLSMKLFNNYEFFGKKIVSL